MTKPFASELLPIRDNLTQSPPLLPGAKVPAVESLPVVHIYQRSRSVMQSAPMLRRAWLLEFEPWCRLEIEPLMGWTSSRDPLRSILPLVFPDRESAMVFAERHGWRFVVHDPEPRRHLRRYAGGRITG